MYKIGDLATLGTPAASAHPAPVTSPTVQVKGTIKQADESPSPIRVESSRNNVNAAKILEHPSTAGAALGASLAAALSASTSDRVDPLMVGAGGVAGAAIPFLLQAMPELMDPYGVKRTTKNLASSGFGAYPVWGLLGTIVGGLGLSPTIKALDEKLLMATRGDIRSKIESSDAVAKAREIYSKYPTTAVISERVAKLPPSGNAYVPLKYLSPLGKPNEVALTYGAKRFVDVVEVPDFDKKTVTDAAQDGKGTIREIIDVVNQAQNNQLQQQKTVNVKGINDAYASKIVDQLRQSGIQAVYDANNRTITINSLPQNATVNTDLLRRIMDNLNAVENRFNNVYESLKNGNIIATAPDEVNKYKQFMTDDASKILSEYNKGRHAEIPSAEAGRMYKEIKRRVLEVDPELRKPWLSTEVLRSHSDPRLRQYGAQIEAKRFEALEPKPSRRFARGALATILAAIMSDLVLRGWNYYSNQLTQDQENR